MYDGCADYWWAQVLFVSNLIPFFEAPNYGCFFWSWPVVTDMQLTLLVPLFVIIFKRCGSKAGHIFVIVCVIENVAVAMYIIFKYQVRAGPIAEENWYLFAMLVEKPWVKTGVFAVGVSFADLYRTLLKYRALRSDAEREATYPGMHWFVKKLWLRKVIASLTVIGCIYILLCAKPAVSDPYKWSMTKNAIFYSVLHLFWSYFNIIGVFMILCGGMPFAQAFLSRPFCIAVGKLCFVTCLITPIMVQLAYTALPDGLFLATYSVDELAIGNVFGVLVAALFLHLLFEFPLKRLT